MRSCIRTLFAAAAVAVLSAGAARAASLTDSLQKGTPQLKSVGQLAFGPEGILFISDPLAANVVAVATGDTTPGPKEAPRVEKLDEKIASMLGTTAKGILINDLKVNPASGNIYLSVSRGTGPDAAPVIVKLTRDSKLAEFPLKDVPFAQVSLPAANTTPNKRGNEIESITGMAFVKDKLIVAGLATEQWASRLRVIPFPFKEADKGAGIEIFHGNHNALETRAPIRTFTPYDIAGQSNIVAAYTCTPLVKIPLDDLKPEAKVKGVTIAELGQQNKPLDMIPYTKDGKDYILMANSARGVMKIPTEGFAKAEPITARVGGIAGPKYETIGALKGVVQLDKLDDAQAVILVQKESKNFDLETIPLP
jgi:hypothetical protein